MLLPGSAFLLRALPARCWLAGIAALVYLVGVFGVTVAGNVPLNEALDKFSLDGSAEAIAAARRNFEDAWNRWNHVRTVAACITLVLMVVACAWRDR